eukprot:2061217-Pyramimonas_sp.AAC.1
MRFAASRYFEWSCGCKEDQKNPNSHGAEETGTQERLIPPKTALSDSGALIEFYHQRSAVICCDFRAQEAKRPSSELELFCSCSEAPLPRTLLRIFGVSVRGWPADKSPSRARSVFSSNAGPCGATMVSKPILDW